MAGDSRKCLDGKSIIVTGAGQGIGAAIAKGAAKLGGRIVVNDIDLALAETVADEIRTNGGEAVAHPCDIAMWSSGEALVQSAIEKFGVLDGLVNNAGIYRFGTFQEMTQEDLTSAFAVNTIGTACCAQAAARYMLPRGSGSIVNIVSGALMGMAGLGAYGASKGAVASLTYAWAVELANSGVRINGVSPRAETRMAEMTRKRNAQAFGTTKPSFPPPAANAPIVCYLLSDLSSGVHGQIIRSDGDTLALITHPGIISPIAQAEPWTVESIDQAFSDRFRANFQQLGISAVSSQPPAAQTKHREGPNSHRTK